MNAPLQVILTGNSGVGKTTLVDRLLESGDYRRGITVTTRQRRPNEPKDAYDFLSPQGFEALKHAGEMAEETVYIGNPVKYGILWSRIREAINTDRPTIWVLDTTGIARMRELFPGRTTSIFLAADKDTLRRRMEGRGEPEASIEKRLARYDEELTMGIQACDHAIDTRHLTPEQVEQAVRALIERR